MTCDGPAGPSGAAESKAHLRAALRAARRWRLPDSAGDSARTRRALAWCGSAEVVAAYASVAGEPETWALLEALRDAGVQVLLPVLRKRPGWAWYEGPTQLRAGPLGILAPIGPELGPEILGKADAILVPGLAGTPDGRRLGTGGGWYDRALGWAAATAPLGLLLFEDEVLSDLPTDSWDRRVDQLITPNRSLPTDRNTSSEFRR